MYHRLQRNLSSLALCVALGACYGPPIGPTEAENKAAAKAKAEMTPAQRQAKCDEKRAEVATLKEELRTRPAWSDEELARGRAVLRSIETVLSLPATEDFEQMRRDSDRGITALDGAREFLRDMGLRYDDIPVVKQSRVGDSPASPYRALEQAKYRIEGALSDAQRASLNIDLLASAKASVEELKCDGEPRWVRQGIGDCGGTDVGSSQGDTPQPSMCSGDAVTAVCWDGQSYSNANEGRPWCTYKRTPTSQCAGGGAPGILYRCEALPEQPER